MQMQGEEDRLVVGVLAIQGAVEEHMQCIRQLGHIAKEVGYST